MDRTSRANLDPGSWLGGAWGRLEHFFGTTPGHAASAAATQPLLPPAFAKLDAARLQVLVAEDDPVHQILTCEILSALDITPQLAADGEEAVALASAHEFDLILMDLQMPVLDGLGATMRIRRFEQEHARARVPVVAYTSCAFGGNEPFLLGFGIDAVLAKPCSPQALQECLLSWAAPGRAAGSSLQSGRGTPVQLI